MPAGKTQILRDLYSELLDNSVSVPGEATARLGAAAREAGVHLAMGMNEINTESRRT